MSVEVGTAYLSIVPSAKGFAGKIQSEIGGDMGSAGEAGGRSYGSGMLGAVKGFAAPLAGVFAVSGAVDFLKDSMAEARESQKIGALTEQVIKSTGGAAAVTADQVGALATAISNKTGIDDEQIQASENMLLTFTNVKNTVGEGNDIFNQATQTVTDMSAALGQDGKSSAIQLGKALNDPIKGITALQRVGVSFTEQQKDQIKAMVAAGDTVGAQKLIIGELNKEFGGAAAAQATAGDKMKTTWANFQEAIGTALLPVIDGLLDRGTQLVGWLTDNIGPAVSTVTEFFKPLVDTVRLFFGAISGSGADVDLPWMDTIIDLGATVRNTFDTLVGGIKTIFATVSDGGGSGATDVFQQIGDAIATVADFFRTNLPPAIATARAAFAAIASFIVTQVVPRVQDIIGAIARFVSVALPIVIAFVSGMRARIEPLLPTVRAIFGTIGEIITAALDLVRAVIERVTGVISWIWTNWGDGIMGTVAIVWNALLNIIGPALELIRNIIRTVTALIHGDWAGVWDGLKGILSAAWDVIKAIIFGALDIVKQVLSLAWDGIKAVALTAWRALVGVVVDAWNDLTGEVSDAVNSVKSGLSQAWDAIKGAVVAAWGAIVGAVSDAWTDVKTEVSDAVNAVKGALSTAWDAVTSTIYQAWESIKSVVAAALDAVVSFLATRWENLKANVSAAWDAIKGLISDAWESIKTAASGGVEGVVTFVASLPGKALAALGNLASTLFSAGSDLIGGFIEGIKARAGDIIAAIRDTITNALPDFVKSALGISSPSRVFMELGAFTAQGMALGIAGGARRVQSAADSLVPSIRVPEFGSLSVPDTAGAGGAGVEQRFYGDIVTRDYSDFQSQMYRSQRVASIGVGA